MIIFDCDGVLVDTEWISNRILAEEITKAGYPMTTEDAIRLFKGGRIKSLPPRLESDFGLNLPSDWLDQYFARQFVALREEAAIIPGVSDVVDTLIARNTGFCVASQASVAKMQITLGGSGLWDRFDGRIFSADMVSRPKPHPDLFLHAAATMGWPAPDCTVIEDSTTGVTAAVAAGMQVIGFSRDTDPQSLRDAGAITIANDMSEVAGFLGLDG